MYKRQAFLRWITCFFVRSLVDYRRQLLFRSSSVSRYSSVTITCESTSTVAIVECRHQLPTSSCRCVNVSLWFSSPPSGCDDRRPSYPICRYVGHSEESFPPTGLARVLRFTSRTVASRFVIYTTVSFSRSTVDLINSSLGYTS